MDELIYRQAAIDTLDVGAELLRRVLDDTDIVGIEREKYEWGLDLIESYISDMKELPPAQTEQRWIPVSERFPEDWVPVLVTLKRPERLPSWIKATPENYYHIVDADVCENGKWSVNGKNVLAWMPLPEPYREKGEQDALNKSEKARQETQGVWLKISPAGIYECSECHQHVMTNDITSYRFCHGCGLRMSTRIES